MSRKTRDKRRYALSKPWLKLWVEWIHDPKILNLSLAERGAWVALLTLAQECDAEGHIVMGNGAPMTLDDVAASLHITKKRELDELASMVQKMENYGSISKNSSSIFIKNFVERQTTVPSDTKEAARERKRKQREKEREQQASSSPTPPTLSKDKDIDIESHGVTGVTTSSPTDSKSHGKPVTMVPSSVQKLSENFQKTEKSVDKKPYGEFQNVLLTTAEFEKLGIKFGNQKAGEMIERMSAGVASKGYKYKSHYAAILNWDNMDKKRAIGDKFHGNVGAKKQPPGVGKQINFIDGDAEPQHQGTGDD